MTMTNDTDDGRPDFAGAFAKIERANEHIAAFEAEGERHFARRPYSVVQSPDPETGRPGYHLYERLAFPDRRLALLVGDAIHNLRAALDHLVFACAAARRGDGAKGHFPILRKDEGLGQEIRNQLREAGPIARDIVRALNPTPSGNPDLVALHELDIADKHRLILPLACVMDVDIDVGGFEGMAVVTARGAAATPASSSAFIPAPPGYEQAVAHDFSFTGDIIFPPGTPLAGKPCAEALRGLSACVTCIAAQFEARFACRAGS